MRLARTLRSLRAMSERDLFLGFATHHLKVVMCAARCAGDVFFTLSVLVFCVRCEVPSPPRGHFASTWHFLRFFCAAREHGQERPDLPLWGLRPEV